MTKKSVLVWLSFLLAPISVLAQTGVRYAPTMNPLGNLAEGFGKLLGYLLMSPGSEIDVLFVKSILFIIMSFVLYSVARQVPFLKESKLIAWVVGLGVSILGLRFLSEEWIKTMLLPYEGVLVALTVFLPLVLFSYFVQKSGSKIVRKSAWVFFAVAFIGLWFWRVEEIGDPAYIYLAGAVGCLVLLYFDGTLQKLWLGMKIGKDTAKSAMAEVAMLQGERDRLVSSFASARNKRTRDSIKKNVDDIEQRMRDLQGM